MKLIPLTQNKFAQVDDNDYEKIIKIKWQYKHGYASTTKIIDGKRKIIYMHRFILEIDDSKIKVDHKSNDGLNNQRYNIRLCNNQQNSCNKGKQTNNTSGYKGVCLYKRYNKWMAYIKIYGKKKTLGYFLDIKDAARAYNIAVIELFGEFACLNKIDN